jgi:hypothetical protein
MYYNKFKYQYGGRADFLYSTYAKLVDSGLVGNMRFEEFSQLPQEQQEGLIQQLSTSNLNQYRYGGRLKGQMGLAAGSTGSNTTGSSTTGGESNESNAAGGLTSWGDNAKAKSGLTALGAAGAQMIGSAISGDAKADTGRAFAGNIVGGMGSGAAAGMAFGPIGAGIGAVIGGLGGLKKAYDAKQLYREGLKDDQKATKIGELGSSYNPQLSSLRYGGRLGYQTNGQAMPYPKAQTSLQVGLSASEDTEQDSAVAYNKLKNSLMGSAPLYATDLYEAKLKHEALQKEASNIYGREVPHGFYREDAPNFFNNAAPVDPTSKDYGYQNFHKPAADNYERFKYGQEEVDKTRLSRMSGMKAGERSNPNYTGFTEGNLTPGGTLNDFAAIKQIQEYNINKKEGYTAPEWKDLPSIQKQMILGEVQKRNNAKYNKESDEALYKWYISGMPNKDEVINKISYNRLGGPTAMENAYAKHRGTLNDNEYSFTGKGVMNINSKGVGRAGYQVGGNTEMRAYPEYRGQQLPTKFMNEYAQGGQFKPRYELGDSGDANVEVESGEAISLLSKDGKPGNPKGLTLHGGADSSHESPVGMMVSGAEHGEKNKAGSEGIPVSFNDPNANPEGAFVYSKYLTLDGKLAKGKGDTPSDSVAGKVKPLLKYAEKATNEKMNDKYYNNPQAMQAVQEEMLYLKDRAMEGKFMHGLDKLVKKKDRKFNEIIDYIKQNNPNAEAQTVEGVGGVKEMQELAGNPNIPSTGQQPQGDPSMGMPPQGMGMEPGMEQGMGMENPEEAMMKKGGWIQDATKSIKDRGTEGVCTGSKFGGPTCPSGSKRYNLAKTFRSMAKNRQQGGYLEPYEENDYNEIEDDYIYRNGGYADYFGHKPTGGVSPEGYYVGGYVDNMVYQKGGHIGYKPEAGNPEGYYVGGYEDKMAYGYGGKFLQEGGYVGYKPESYSVAPEGYYIGGYVDKMAYQKGGAMIPTYQDPWRKRTYSEPVDQDYYGESSHIQANTTTPYKMGGMMGDNKYMGYSRNQSLYGGMINTKTSPFWIAQEGMQVPQEGMPQEGAPQPQSNPELAAARQAMLSNRPSAEPTQGQGMDPMMQGMSQQGMEQGNPIQMIAQALPDWFKEDNGPGGLGIFTQPAVAELRKNGFSDREIASFDPSQVGPEDEIMGFLAQIAMPEGQGQPQQQMPPQGQPMAPEEMQAPQMKRGGSIGHLKRGEYVQFKLGGTAYSGRVKYFDPRTGNFELEN